ncbi:acyl-[acyl-carrier-protein] thioesterase [Desulfobaculum xiamenense]|nr:acyl-ACP thioesterase domain-containing protein [Desulfobaculum xiamenense]
MDISAPKVCAMDFRVRVTDAGADERGSIVGVAGFLQEIAAHHARLLGFGTARLNESGVTWVLAREYVEMRRYPVYGESVRVETWPASLERSRARRDFRILDADGAELGVATSVWAPMDLATRRLGTIPEGMSADFPETPCHSVELPGRAVSRLRDVEAEARILARRGDIDVNGHVNNVHFFEWALECLPGDTACRPATLDISFRAEAVAGQVILARCARQDDGSMLHALVREDDGAEVARVRTTWASSSEGR